MSALRSRLTMLSALLILASAYAVGENSDLFESNKDIYVDASEKPSDVTCLNCSIHVRGEVHGDVTAFHGSVILENGAQVSGDTTALFGDIRLEANSSAGRDVTAIAGKIRRDSQAAVRGDVTALDGGGWMFLIVILPLAFLGGMVAFVVWLVLWLVRRNTSHVPVAA